MLNLWKIVFSRWSVLVLLWRELSVRHALLTLDMFKGGMRHYNYLSGELERIDFWGNSNNNNIKNEGEKLDRSPSSFVRVDQNKAKWRQELD